MAYTKRATCDECSEVTPVKYEEQTHPRGVIETYFRCNSCGHKYVCFVTDGKVRKLQKDMRRIRNKPKFTDEDARILDEMFTEVGRLMAKLKAQD